MVKKVSSVKKISIKKQKAAAKPKKLPAKAPKPAKQKQLTRFCPSCGTITDELFEGFCRKCFLENVELIQAAKRIQFCICYDCGRARLNKFWQSFGSKNELVRNMVTRHSRALRGAELDIRYDDFTIKGKTEVPVTLTAEYESNSKKITKSKEMLLVILPEICPDCSRLRGGYYEGIMQLRGKNQEKMQAHIEKAFSKFDKSESNAFISKIERLSEGIDIYIGSRTAGLKVSSEIRKIYNVDCTITNKIHGMRQGKEIRRTTILLRGIEPRNRPEIGESSDEGVI
ncbi:60S ribosomal export protein NMD3 [archaeon]|nr:60S ribosomal export protein NMD3 [Nanoarchaeota archaeon]MBU4451182.1 60S ribosomal export protein NMD3 [Nanoarchaeota archaeon]MCG2723245.1 60S ribosomal export protein NMD3 [archaeon]